MRDVVYEGLGSLGTCFVWQRLEASTTYRPTGSIFKPPGLGQGLSPRVLALSLSELSRFCNEAYFALIRCSCHFIEDARFVLVYN